MPACAWFLSVSKGHTTQKPMSAEPPEEKNWPGWVDDDPTVRLLIGETIFSGTLADVTDAKEIERLRGAYEKKYDLESMVQGVRYWRVAAPQSDA